METIDLKKIQLAWDHIAEGYDNYVTPSHDGHFTAKLLRLAGLQSGMKFLDIAAGSGALTIPAARMRARVTAVDISPNMVRLLQERAKKEGLTNVEGYVMDGHALDLPDDSFDIAGSQFGVMLFPDLPRGLREMVRVTKPGGTVLVIAFSAPDRVDFIQFFFTALQIVVPGFRGLPQDPPPLPFQVADPNVFHRRMEEAGLQGVQIIREVEQMKYNSGAALWNSVISSNPIALQVTADLTEKQKIQVQQALEDMVREQAGGNDVAVLKAELNVAVGKV